MRFAVLLLSSFLLAVAGVAHAAPVVGANKFDLFAQYVGTASGCNQTAACRRVTQAMAKKAIEDAANAGIPFLRVGMTGAVIEAADDDDKGDDEDERNTLALWEKSPEDFWRIVDEMMNDLDANGVQIVPVLMWSGNRFATMAGETMGDLVANPSSRSWRLLSSFTTQFVTRYKGRRTILFYELTNELNNKVDLDHLRRCQTGARKALCNLAGNFSTDQMVDFTTRFADLIRRIDRSKKISSGFTVPRPGASSMRERPEWVRSGGPRRKDTAEQFVRHLQYIHRGVDIISIHLYPNEHNKRFGSDDYLTVVAEAKRAADQAGKPLFVGEFGDNDPLASSPSSAASRMIDAVARLGVQYSAVWAWEFYQRNTYTTRNTRASRFSLEPGATDYLIGKMAAVNGVSARRAADTRPPTVVLTWPLECARIRDGQAAHAVASDDSGKISRVEFWLGDRQVGADDAAPFETRIAAREVPAGEYMLTARAFDPSGRRSEFATRVVVGDAASSGSACR